MDKVDKILQEIYLEMEIEELEEELNQLNEKNILKEDLKTQLSSIMQRIKNATDKASQASGPEKAEIMKQLNDLKAQAVEVRNKIASDISRGAGNVSKTVSDTGKQIASSDVGKAVSKGAQTAASKVSAVAGKAGELAQANPGIAAGAAAIAAIAASVAIYKRFFSQAARACKGKSGADRKNCINSFKAKGLQAAKAKVMSGMSKCKDPKCKAKLQAKAQGFDAKIRALKGNMAESLIDSYVGDYIHEIQDLLGKDSKN